jgi:plasmid maintenance system antidote protein VapI
MQKEILQIILETEERSPHWLSKKINCSHTLVYKWLNGKVKISDEYEIKINKLFGRGGIRNEQWTKDQIQKVSEMYGDKID